MSDDLAHGGMEASLGVPLVIAYSLTEAASTSGHVPPRGPGSRNGSSPWAVPSAAPRSGSGSATARSLPRESVGEIAARGPGLMRGYYRQPRETAAATDSDGYLRTGDLGLVDEDGYLHLVGRREDVVIRGGFKVHPREVEDRIMAHPGGGQCRRGGPPRRDPGRGDLRMRGPGGRRRGDRNRRSRAWGAATLAGYKVPDLVSFMEELPLTDTGTVRRRELARRVSAMPPHAPAERKPGDD